MVIAVKVDKSVSTNPNSSDDASELEARFQEAQAPSSASDSAEASSADPPGEDREHALPQADVPLNMSARDELLPRAAADAGDVEDADDVEELDETQDETEDEEVEPLELLTGGQDADEELEQRWYILKVQVNREESIRDALLRRVKIEGLDRFFGDIVVPTEDVAEFSKSGKRRIVKKKLYPGYIMVHMAINDDTWFLVRETPGIGDFTGSAGKPTPMNPADVERILNLRGSKEDAETQIKTAIPYKASDRVRVKEGYFQNFEGDVESVDEANGRVTVMINIFGRSTPVELEHWQIESV
jgi:transcriptional antiterminator NusG